MCVGFFAGATYLRFTVVMSPEKDEAAVHCCDPNLSALVMFGVFGLSRSISLAVYCLSLYKVKGGKFLKKLWCCVGGSITR